MMLVLSFGKNIDKKIFGSFCMVKHLGNDQKQDSSGAVRHS